MIATQIFKQLIGATITDIEHCFDEGKFVCYVRIKTSSGMIIIEDNTGSDGGKTSIWLENAAATISNVTLYEEWYKNEEMFQELTDRSK